MLQKIPVLYNRILKPCNLATKIAIILTSVEERMLYFLPFRKKMSLPKILRGLIAIPFLYYPVCHLAKNIGSLPISVSVFIGCLVFASLSDNRLDVFIDKANIIFLFRHNQAIVDERETKSVLKIYSHFFCLCY